MRVVIQRVKEASVKEKRKIKSRIKRGLLLYLAVAESDTSEDVEVLVEKIIKLRLFAQKGKKHDFQQSIKDIKGEILVIPNYTLYSDVTGGNRPYFGEAAKPKDAKPLYIEFLEELEKTLGSKIRVKSGTFGEFMEVAAISDGPATIILETALIDENMYQDLEEDEYTEDFDDLLGRLGVDLDF